MKRINKTQVVLFALGILLFVYSIYVLGGASVELFRANFNAKYMWLYVVFTTLAIFPLVWRWQAILKGYGKSIGFFKLLRMQLAGYAVSFVTPSSRIGGEPLRIYMLKKECNVDYKTGTASIILDKYMEYLGSLTFGFIGVALLIFVPNMPELIRLILFGAIIFSMLVLTYVYYRLSREKGLFHNLFSIFLSKKRLGKMSKSLKDIDSRLSYFMIHQKRAFFASYFFYIVSAVVVILEFKFLLLSFGVSTSLLELILVVMIVGITTLIPLPMALGSMEFGQSGLFALLKNQGGVGLLFSLIYRIRGLVFSAIGFCLLIIFSGKDILRKSKRGV